MANYLNTTPKYWCYMRDILSWRNQDVQAKLVQPERHLKVGRHESGYGFKSVFQCEPYGVKLEFVYKINKSYPHPDNYYETHSFRLFSERLVSLLDNFDVKYEIFPVTLIDENEKMITDLKYYVFHSLEKEVDAMDHEKSQWTGDWKLGVPHLILKNDGYNPRPIFNCKHVNVNLIRDDLKQALNKSNITGFCFLNPQKYSTIKENGMYPKIWDVEWDD